MNITDEMLYGAAPEAAERWLSTLPEREDCGHDFSLTFEAAMRPLLRKRRRRWRALALLAAVVSVLGTLLAFGVSADRPDEYRVYAAQEEGLLSYRAIPKDDGSTQAFHQLTPEWVPEDFSATGVDVREGWSALYYDTQGGRRLYLWQWHRMEEANSIMGTYQLEQVRVDGEEALFFASEDTRESYLLWVKGADAFLLYGMNVEKGELLHVAESLKW